MNILQRTRNLWKLSGIEVHDTSPKQDALNQMADVFKSPTGIKPTKKMATIISRNEPEHVETD